MSLLTALHEIVSQLPIRRSNDHGGEQASGTEGMTSVPREWRAGQELERRAEEVDRVGGTVRVTGLSAGEWVEGSGVEVRR